MMRPDARWSTGPCTRCSRALVLAAVFFLAGCVGRSDERGIELRIATAVDVNPNAMGRPSPVAIQLIPLDDPVRFLTADVAELERDPVAELGETLAGAPVERLVPPAEEARLQLEIDRDVPWLGVVAYLYEVTVPRRCLVDLRGRLRGLVVRIDAGGLPVDQLASEQGPRCLTGAG